VQVSKQISCGGFPCQDVRHECYLLPRVDIEPEQVSVMLISECAPQDCADYYYASGQPHFAQTTVQAFQEAGAQVDSIADILDMGVYLTTAIKCAKTSYNVKAATIKECSWLLEQELDLFPSVQAYLLMGDVAIKALNYVSQRQEQGRVIPAGSTYKLRGGRYTFRGKPAFPSYLQAGPSFGIETSKRRMIAQDIAAAIALVQ
jgi:uracil-DNA glycosylase